MSVTGSSTLNGSIPESATGATGSASDAATNPRPMQASEIGWLFVPQYYTFLNHNPQRLHCFYNKRSTLIHGTEQEDTKPCFGQQEIHQKLLSLGFEDCKVFVSTVDSQSSADGGILVQVLGEMSNKGEPWRKFAQTFFLAEQPNGYFVLNDIFRFLKEEEEVEEEAAQVDGAIEEEIEQAEKAGTTVPHQVDISAVAQPGATPNVKSVAAADSSARAIAAAPTDTSVAPAGPVQDAQANGILKPQEPTPAEPKEIGVDKKVITVDAGDVAPSQPAGVAAAADAAAQPSAPKSQAAEPTPAASAAAAETSNKEGAQSTSKPVPAQNGSTPAAAPAAPSAPKTWANLAASNVNKWGSTVSAEARGVSSASPSTTPSQQSSSRQQQSQQQQQNHSSSNGHGTGLTAQQVAQIQNPGIFVKNVLSDKVSEADLRNALETLFGPMKECQAIPSKACAFGEFVSVEAARKAITMSLPTSAGGEGAYPSVTLAGP
ncbi:hypothetical protein L7F22_068386 [Adiantum nelumboides]|nr:hypothetical protein [Adiantum nelumboides]